jgi:hypothetical protein
MTPKENDIFSWLLDRNATKVSPELNADSRLLVVAGRYVRMTFYAFRRYSGETGILIFTTSDTTAATLAWIVYELCKQPAIQAKLREQIDAIAPFKSHLDVEDVANCAFLDGVIHEALRLHPAVGLLACLYPALISTDDKTGSVRCSTRKPS